MTRFSMTLGLTTVVLFSLACLSAQSARGDSLRARFSSDSDAQAFAAWAEFMGQSNGAMITHNADGSTSVILPDVATERMAETALDAIDANSNAIQVGPAIPSEVIDAIEQWFDGFQAQGNTAMAPSSFTDGFEYVGNISSAIGFDRSYLQGNTFFAYLSPPFTVVAEITALDPSLEEPIKAAIEAAADARGILILP